MTTYKPKDRLGGLKFTIVHCEGALESYAAALDSVQANRRGSFTSRMIAQIQIQIQRLADGHRMSKESFPQEGELPKRKGQHGARKFNALKRIPTRGYCWLSERHENTYFVSHYVYKDQDKLNTRDTSRVGANWTRIEERGYER